MVRLALAPAPGWAAAVLAIHVAAAGAALAWIPFVPSLLVVAGLALSAWAGTSAALVRGPQAVREIELRADGSAAYADAGGEWHEAAVEGAASLGHRFAALRLRAGRQRRNVVLVPGTVEPAAFRRARVWARWRQPAA